MSQATPDKHSRNRPPDVTSLIDRLGADTRIKHQEMALLSQKGSLRMALMADAWRDAGIDKDNPDSIDQYYYRDEGIVLIDLNGRFEG